MTNENPALQLADELEDFAKDVWERLPETIRQVSVNYRTADKKTRQEIVNTLQGDILKRRITLSGICKGEDLADALFDLNWENRADEQKDLRTWIRIVSTEFEHHFPLNTIELACRLESGKFFCTDQDWWNSRILVNKAVRLLRSIARNQKKDGQGNTQPDGPYTRGVGQNIWVKVLGVSRSKVQRFIYDKSPDRTYHFKQISPRKWALPINEVPADAFEKYKMDFNPPTDKNAY